MTDDHVDPPPPDPHLDDPRLDDPHLDDPHLDDEVLVALLDGEATPAEEAAAGAHLPGCGQCTARRDALAGTLGLAGAPVAPLPPAVRDVQIRQALMAAPPAIEAEPGGTPDAGVPPPRPLPVRPPARHRQGVGLRAAAVLVVVAALGAAVYGASRIGGSGSEGAGSPATSLPEAAMRPPALGWLRPVAGPPPRSCPSVDFPSAPTEPLPDAILPAPHGRPSSECLLAGPVAVSIPTDAGVRLSGPPGLVGPDTLTFELAPDLVPARLLGSPPPGPELVLHADGAAVGVVRSVTRHGNSVQVVVGEIPPAVAEYLKGLFLPPTGH